VELEEIAFGRERLGKLHVTAAYRGSRGNETREELWEDVFSAQSVAGLCGEN
jgi:hypothetical protein